MVYKFDPMYFNGTIFDLDDTCVMAKGWAQLSSDRIPASYFPKSLVFTAASAKLPDMFHMSRGFFVFSERARVVVEHWAPGQLEFIPVAYHAKPKVAATLDFAHAYYFINVLGRAQRMQWRSTPSYKIYTRDDGTELFMPLPGLDKWELRERAPGEPLIWRDTPWRDGNKEYGCQSDPFIEDILWRELDANFPDQLHALRVGGD
ncbi:hypothetical protein FBZ93_10351 [Bradyrhizobium macuxiense]|uniref:Uncharacterized protein n=1 Tax=Bradyrhizobium macuxiense TaxID=1755647 RepID=A0A560MF33_9BRAD|nr:hypothetical protein [Bradyrhizobium macuxiense]TWC05041.1 hypothetical protein FBZ93_10351 [Bradyrhizobium macuxiense]